MVPAFLEAVSDLPLLPNGKLNRRSLKPPSVGPRGESPPSDATSRLTPTERIVADVWHELLRWESIDGNSEFFKLGGDSLRAAQAVSRPR